MEMLTPLAAAASRSATHALIATAVSHHDRAAHVATGSVSHVDHVSERIGCVNRASRRSLLGTLLVARWTRAVQIADALGHCLRLRTQVLKQKLLLSGHEAQLQPAENVVHDRLGEAYVGIARPSARLEARVRELLAE